MAALPTAGRATPTWGFGPVGVAPAGPAAVGAPRRPQGALAAALAKGGRMPPARRATVIIRMPRVIPRRWKLRSGGFLCIFTCSEDNSPRTILIQRAPRLLLQVKEGQVDLPFVPAGLVCAPRGVKALADAEAFLQAMDESARVQDLVLFKPQPQRWSIGWSRSLSRADDALHAVPRELVVRKVNLLNRGALLAELGELVSAMVVDLILVELEDPELLAAEAEVQDHAQPIRRQPVLREVDFIIGVVLLSQR
mmetsp:Transcript_64174/g.178004  ORF Transcript_64174/g.178004 Transcript_64174/m.178004 type:complete len:252 (+) Transcript_64174:53-808(+)